MNFTWQKNTRLKYVTYRIIIRIVTGVLSVDALQAFQGIVVVSALHHEFGTLGEREEPETEEKGRNTTSSNEPVPRVVGECTALNADALD